LQPGIARLLCFDGNTINTVYSTQHKGMDSIKKVTFQLVIQSLNYFDSQLITNLVIHWIHWL